MSHPTTWHSKGRLDSIRSQLERIMQEMDVALGHLLPERPVHRGPGGHVRPAIDVHTADETLILTADLPGFTDTELSLTLDDRTLTLCGEPSRDSGRAVDGYHQQERIQGAFRRQIDLPGAVVAAEAQATLERGVLTVRMPLKDVAEGGLHHITVTSRV